MLVSTCFRVGPSQKISLNDDSPTITEFPRLATFPEDGDALAASLNVKYNFEAGTFSGYDVAISSLTTTFILDTSTTVMTITLWYDSNVISSEGLEVITQTETVTTCTDVGATSAPTSAAPTGTCEPHDDHWHCPPGVPEPSFPPPQPSGEPTGTTATTGPAPSQTGDHDHDDDEECTAHDDHWHCPPGVEEPPFPPGGGPGDEDDHDHDHGHDHDGEGEECTAHDDHWHCPPGVEEPSYPPGGEPGGDHDHDHDHDHDNDAEEGECTAHDDHWHCPPGVSEPSTPPAPAPPATTAPPASAPAAGESTSFVPAPATTTGFVQAGAGKAAPGAAMVSALAGLSLFGFFYL